MDNFYINADELEEEEINYELSLRALPVGGSTENRRQLRYWLRQEGTQECSTSRTINDDYQVVLVALKHIEDLLLAGRTIGCRSRLVHYYRRLRRCHALTAKELKGRQFLLDSVCRLAKTYLPLDLTRIEYVIPFGNQTPRNPFQPTRDVNLTSASQRTLVTPPNTPQNSDPASDHDVEATGDPKSDPLNEQRIAWARQVMNDGGSGGPVSRVRHSVDSRIPAPNNLQEELGRAARSRISDGGTRLPFRGTPHLVQGNVPRQNNSMNPFVAPALSSFEHGIDEVPEPTQSNQTPVRNHEVPPQVGNPSTSQVVPSSDVDASYNPPHRIEEVPRGIITGNLNQNFQEPINFTGVNQEQNQELNTTDYVHIADIQNYVQTYVRQLLSSRPDRPIVRDTIVNNLARQIADIGIHDTELSRLSRQEESRVPAPPSALRLSPPLQLHQPLGFHRVSEYPPETRRERINEETPRVFRNFQRNSWPMFPGQAESTHYGDVTAGDHRNEPHNRRDNQPIFSESPSRFNSGLLNQVTRGRLPHQTCNILEKWPKFAGDANPVPVVDFLRQIDLLCRSYQISKEELKTHAHLLFKEDASVWYTAYEPRFDSWDTLLYYLRMRYDNPNRDRFVREEMRNRKQRPNELFSAFLTDMETLAQRLIRRMTEAEKFDIIVENMKISYKRRLALEDVGSIEQLAQLCYRFDTLEAHLYNPKALMKPHGINEISIEEHLNTSVCEEDDEGELNVIDIRKSKGNFRNRKSDPSDSVETPTRAKPLCWNCRMVGHLWRECDQKKTIFCHMCGHPDVTAFHCPQQHNPRFAAEDKSKNV